MHAMFSGCAQARHVKVICLQHYLEHPLCESTLQALLRTGRLMYSEGVSISDLPLVDTARRVPSLRRSKERWGKVVRPLLLVSVRGRHTVAEYRTRGHHAAVREDRCVGGVVELSTMPPATRTPSGLQPNELMFLLCRPDAHHRGGPQRHRRGCQGCGGCPSG